MQMSRVLVPLISVTAVALASGCGDEASGAGSGGAADSGSGAAIEKSTCDKLGEEYADLEGRTLTVGISPAPANYSATDPEDPNNIIGIEPDLLAAAGECLGFTTTYSKLDFAGLVPALQSKRIDLVAAGMYSSEERKKQVDFVEYMKAGEAALVQAGNPKKIAALGDICGTTAALVVGTVENEIIEKQSADCTTAGEQAVKTLPFPSIDRAQSALAQGEADVVLTDAGVAAYLAEKASDKLAVGFDLPTEFRFGFAVNKEDAQLRDGLHAALAAMHTEGTLQKAVGHWGFSKAQELEPAVATD